MDPQTDEPELEYYCFLDAGRKCGGDCMAYVTFPQETKLDAEQSHCLLLQSMEKTTRHVIIAAGALVQREKKASVEAADRQRLQNASTQIPVPRKP